MATRAQQHGWNPWTWLTQRDRGLLALRRAARAAILMPLLFAFGDKVVENADIAVFAAIGAFALLMLVDFGGPMRERLEAQATLAVAGLVLVTLGTLCSGNAYLAAGAMLVVGFAVLFAGVVSSVLASASTALLLSFILPVSLKGDASAVPDRLLGWGLASAASLVAIGLLWPAPVRNPLRGLATAACHAVAARLRADVEYMRSDGGDEARSAHAAAIAESDRGIAALRAGFTGSPFRPTGLSTPTRTLVRLVDELTWVNLILSTRPAPVAGREPDPAACVVKQACATVLEHGAALLESHAAATDDLERTLVALRTALGTLEDEATRGVPLDDAVAGDAIHALDPSFRAQELSFAIEQIGINIRQTVAAEHRSMLQRLLGHQPEGVASALEAARVRAMAHTRWDSVWLHNSVRGAVGLAIAVLISNKSGVQHSFWVVLGTLSVLRSNALNTGQFVARGVLGTSVGFVVGAVLLELIGTNSTVLWCLLPFAILFAGIAPAAISFAAGQAAFTLVLVILFNIIQPAGWRVGLTRVEDVALGCGVSLVVGLLFWPRGAAPALRKAIADAYVDSARYLDEAVAYGIARCSPGGSGATPPAVQAERASSSARRLDDAYRTYLTEQGPKPVPLADMTTLVTGVTALRLASAAVLDLWQRDDGTSPGDRAAARAELQRTSDHVRSWYVELAADLADANGATRRPQEHDDQADRRLLDAIRGDLRDPDGHATPTAVRVIWTGDHLEAARRLQGVLVGPAAAANAAGRLGPLAGLPLGRPPAVA